MPRPVKKGLEYFPMDIDLFQDVKIRKLIKYQGGKAVSVYTYLLCSIYKEGYYIEWDKELPFIISEATGYEEAYIHEVINVCLNIGLFSLSMFEKYKIFTSKGIQDRYLLAVQSMRRSICIVEYSLINAEETPVNVEETPVNTEETTVNVEETPVSSGFSTQRKGKERKGKEKKVKSSETEVSGKMDFIDKIILEFRKAYKKIRGEDYVIVNIGKERSAAGSILQVYKKKFPDSGSQEMLQSLHAYFLETCAIKDEWLYRNMSIPIISSKFNEINQTIKRDGKNINRKPLSEKFRSADALIDQIFSK